MLQLKNIEVDTKVNNNLVGDSDQITTVLKLVTKHQWS